MYERKRHTDRSISCPWLVLQVKNPILSSVGRGVPHLVLVKEYPTQSLPEEYPILSCLGGIHPVLVREACPGMPPLEGTWTSGSIMEWRWGTPCGPTDRCLRKQYLHPSFGLRSVKLLST